MFLNATEDVKRVKFDIFVTYFRVKVLQVEQGGWNQSHDTA